MINQFEQQLSIVYQMLDYLPISVLNEIDLEEYIKVRKLQMADGKLEGIQEELKAKKRGHLRIVK